MLTIKIPESERWDEKRGIFLHNKETTLKLEHSLISISKWESIHNKVFLSKDTKTTEEILSYIQCMTITQNVDPDIYNCLTQANLKEVTEYINAPMTATVINVKETGHQSREPMTSEMIYYMMVALQIPFEAQTWHLNRLITLIRICGIKNQPPKKMSQKALMSRNAALNAERRKRLQTKG